MKITIIGAGNVGTHLALQLHKCGHTVHQVFSRNLEKAIALSEKVGAIAFNDLSQVEVAVDLIILSISDSAIELVAHQLSKQHSMLPLVVHTSGATPSTVFQNHLSRYGVFYPLQTFSMEKNTNFKKLPICVDANNLDDLNLLMQLGASICPNIYQITDKERSILHVCAVIVNNFTNHLFAITEEILEKENIAFDILKPLIQETVNKIQSHSAHDMQTGPARRKDEGTINRHLDFLEQYPDYQLIYKLLSDSIWERY